MSDLRIVYCILNPYKGHVTRIGLEEDVRRVGPGSGMTQRQPARNNDTYHACGSCKIQYTAL
jgi:hypothetical protein